MVAAVDAALLTIEDTSPTLVPMLVRLALLLDTLPTLPVDADDYEEDAPASSSSSSMLITDFGVPILRYLFCVV